MMQAQLPATVRGLIERQAALRPAAVYARATESAQQIAYGELQSACGRVATLLRSQGLAPGDTVSLVMPNGLGTPAIDCMVALIHDIEEGRRAMSFDTFQILIDTCHTASSNA